MKEATLEFLKENIGLLVNELKEKRSDISEILEGFLEGVSISDNPKKVEGRHVTAKIQGTNLIVYYDTLTTVLDYKDTEKDEWISLIDHVYED